MCKRDAKYIWFGNNMVRGTLKSSANLRYLTAIKQGNNGPSKSVYYIVLLLRHLTQLRRLSGWYLISFW